MLFVNNAYQKLINTYISNNIYGGFLYGNDETPTKTENCPKPWWWYGKDGIVCRTS